MRLHGIMPLLAAALLLPEGGEQAGWRIFLPEPGAPDIAPVLDRALWSLRDGDPPAAVEQLEALSGTNPGDAETRFFLGIACWAGDRMYDARRHLVESTRLPGGYGRSLIALAAIAASQDDIAESAGWLKKAVQTMELDEVKAWIADPMFDIVRYNEAFDTISHILSDRTAASQRDAETAQPSPIPGPRFDDRIRLKGGETASTNKITTWEDIPPVTESPAYNAGFLRE